MAMPFANLYNILTGAGPHTFVLGPEIQRVTGLDADQPVTSIERHAGGHQRPALHRLRRAGAAEAAA